MLPIVLQIVLSCFGSGTKKPIVPLNHKGRKKRIRFTPPLIHVDVRIKNASVLQTFSLD